MAKMMDRRVGIVVAAAGFLCAAMLAAATLPVIDGTDGDDVIDSSYTQPTSDAAEKIKCRQGNDLVKAGGGNDEVLGHSGNNELWGEGGNDLIEGGGGDDAIHGGAGDDTMKGGSGQNVAYGGHGNDVYEGTGSGWDYIDGGRGQDHLDGMSAPDVLIGRDGDDTLVGGPGDDVLVVIGNQIGNHAIHPGTLEGYDYHTDLLFFARTFDPSHVQVLEVNFRGRVYNYLEINSFASRTDQPVSFNFADVPGIDCVVSGTADDHLIGTDNTGHAAYGQRFLYTGTPLGVNQIFLSGPGNDTIETGGGNDYVDAGEGDDIIRSGSGANFIISGPGNDTLIWPAAALDGGMHGATKTIIQDLTVRDRLLIEGSINPAAISIMDQQVVPFHGTGSDQTRVQAAVVHVNGKLEWALPGIRAGRLAVQQVANGVEIKLMGPATGETEQGEVENRKASPFGRGIGKPFGNQKAAARVTRRPRRR